jgi:hypothetical protein
MFTLPVFTTVLSTKMPETVRRDISALAPWAMKKVPKEPRQVYLWQGTLTEGEGSVLLTCLYYLF